MASGRDVSGLWRRMIDSESITDQIPLMKTMLRSLSIGGKANTLTPLMVQYLINSVWEEHKPAEVKLLSCAIILKLMDDMRLVLLFCRNNIIPKFVGYMKTWMENPKDLANKAVIEVYIHVLKILAFIATSAASDQNMDILHEMSTTEIVSQICEFIDPELSPLYKNNKTGCDVVADLTLNKNLVGQVFLLTPKSMENIFEDYIGEMSTKLLLPKASYAIDLFDTSNSDCDVKIVEKLEDFGIVWIRKNDEGEIDNSHTGENDPESEVNLGNNGKGEVMAADSWADVQVIRIVDNLHFWARLGEESEEAVSKVKEILKQLPQVEKKMLKVAPKVGCFVGGCHALCDGDFRAQVVQVDGDDALLFALDYGYLVSISWCDLYLITPQMKLSTIKPQAVMCKIKGASYPPISIDVVELCLVLLTQLSRKPMLDNDCFQAPSIFKCLQFYTQCVNTSLAQQAMRLVSNLCQKESLADALCQYGMMEKLVETIKNYFDGVEGAQNETKVQLCLSAITNMMCVNAENKTKFADSMNGLSLLIKLAHPSNPETINKAAIKALRVYDGTIDVRQGFTCLTKQQNRVGVDSKKSPVMFKQTENTSRKPKSQSTTPKPDNMPQRWVARQLTASHVEKMISDNYLDENPVFVSAREVLKEDKYRSCNTYAWGMSTDLRSNESTVLIQCNDIRKCNESELSQNACALLNSIQCGQSGHIYLGFQPNGVCIGVDINRDQRDMFRLGIDAMMDNKLQPTVQHWKYNVTFMPVIHPTLSVYETKKESIQKKYVIDIELKSTSDVLFTCEGKVFVREGRKNVILSLPELHKKVILDTEKQFLPEYESLLNMIEEKKTYLKQLKLDQANNP